MRIFKPYVEQTQLDALNLKERALIKDYMYERWRDRNGRPSIIQLMVFLKNHQYKIITKPDSYTTQVIKPRAKKIHAIEIEDLCDALWNMTRHVLKTL